MDTVILEFNDGYKLNVLNIFGGPVNIDGIIRDVLTIEIDTKTDTIDNINKIFNNSANLIHLYSYESDYNENGDITDIKIEIGEGYTILLGVEEITRKVDHFSGKILPDEYETIYSVTIAQMTYEEWILAGYNK